MIARHKNLDKSPSKLFTKPTKPTKPQIATLVIDYISLYNWR